ncbi:hypothetical protein QTP86_015336 [Hemibagrus guttatus]|nr:hypothetical protein QTP86_015336 [Hemibagrus guttatus]
MPERQHGSASKDGIKWRHYNSPASSFNSNQAASAPPAITPAPRGRLAWCFLIHLMASLIAAATTRQCDNFFTHQPDVCRECSFMLSLLTGRALDWASAVWYVDRQVKASFVYFAGLIREVFEYLVGGKDISVQLLELCQGSEPAADYAIKFRTLTAQSGWNKTALLAFFVRASAQLFRRKWCAVT